MSTWKSEEIEILEKYYPLHGADYCAEKLNRSRQAVCIKASRLDLKRDGNTRYNRIETPDGYTHCFGCNQTLPDGYFYKKTKDGIYGKKKNLCRACCQVKSRNHYRQHNCNHFKNTRANPEKYLVNNAKARAKKRGLEFNLKPEDIIIPKKCPVLGIEIKLFDSSDHSPSIDRMDSTKGYTKDNCCVISKRANTLKSSATIEEVEMILHYMKEGA